MDGYYEWSGSCVECPKSESDGLLTAGFFVIWIFVILLHVVTQLEDSGLTKALLYFISTINYLLGSQYRWLSWLGIFNFNPNTTTGEIGRAVQQECRDRSRMPSSA
eukprot:TRINITY_DN86008_c0_g1_i1.p1 TRINITY_DN86008_c0_g1~~TRINITY_DN86008_c0_g1_i1.p1  ORF type:complete len:119 (-),score=20.41 TRINITY_DN86008_c0_g1_i1:10-327(-)